jgi:monofunctional biosynthetic peptidoglycan transglycosylase
MDIDASPVALPPTLTASLFSFCLPWYIPPSTMTKDMQLTGRRSNRRGYGKLERLQARALARLLAQAHSRPRDAEGPDSPLGHGESGRASGKAEGRAEGQAEGQAPWLSPFPLPTVRRGGILGALRIVGLGILLAHALYIATVAILVAVYARVDPPATVLMAYRKWGYGWKLQMPRPLPLRRVPVQVRSMLIAVEDRKFFSHSGFDFDAFERARAINKKLGKPLYGGSTLTMQLARTLFLVPEKSYLRKYLEAIATLELEIILSKDRILELYFSYAEWGKGIFGIEAAARHWYGRSLSSLTRDQTAKLISLLSSPIKYGPETLRRSKILRERYDYLAARFMTVKPSGAQSSPPETQASAAVVPAATAPATNGTAVMAARSGPPQAEAKTAIALASALIQAAAPSATVVAAPTPGSAEPLQTAAEEEEGGIEGPPLDLTPLSEGPGEAVGSSGTGSAD